MHTMVFEATTKPIKGYGKLSFEHYAEFEVNPDNFDDIRTVSETAFVNGVSATPTRRFAKSFKRTPNDNHYENSYRCFAPINKPKTEYCIQFD